MNWLEFSKNILQKYNIDISILDNYFDKNKYYHNWEHIEYMFNKSIDYNIKLTDELILAILFHDIVYNPKNNNNEEHSIELFNKFLSNREIEEAILSTKNHEITNALSEKLIILDTCILHDNVKDFLDYDYKIFKEYQFVDYTTYTENRTAILKKLNVKNDWIEFSKNRKLNIAIYPGSFNPIHLGHLNIIEKAEKIFDKVIIARGKNPDKLNNKVYDLPDSIKNRQIIEYDGLLTDLIDSFKYNVTIIRGLRNSTDLQYEMTQYRFLKDLKSDVKVVSIFCDPELEHISSSSIKMLEKYNKHNQYLI